VAARILRRDRAIGRAAGWALALAWGLLEIGGMAKADALQSTAAKTSPRAHRLGGRLPGKPAYLFLWYADGSPAPEDGPYCTGVRPPAFKCNYGATLDDCQRQVQTYLDLFYADFNILFSLTRPPTGDYYVMIITSDGTWCQQNPIEAGVAPFNCNDNPEQSAYAFDCGYSAQACATMIAHEHGHLVGLEHTISITDVMNPTILVTATGFDDKINHTVDGLCEPTQNSYQQMLTALGAWPGGSKASPFSSTPDAGAPDLSPADAAAAPSTGGSLGNPSGAPENDGSVSVLAGFDAIARVPVSTVDAAEVNAPAPHGGCGVEHEPKNGSLSVALALVALVLRAARRTRSTRPATSTRDTTARRP
jgi:hypothetical protein